MLHHGPSECFSAIGSSMTSGIADHCGKALKTSPYSHKEEIMNKLFGKWTACVAGCCLLLVMVFLPAAARAQSTSSDQSTTSDTTTKKSKKKKTTDSAQ